MFEFNIDDSFIQGLRRAYQYLPR